MFALFPPSFPLCLSSSAYMMRMSFLSCIIDSSAASGVPVALQYTAGGLPGNEKQNDLIINTFEYDLLTAYKCTYMHQWLQPYFFHSAKTNTNYWVPTVSETVLGTRYKHEKGMAPPLKETTAWFQGMIVVSKQMFTIFTVMESPVNIGKEWPETTIKR